MEEKKALYEQAMSLLEGCNKHLKDNAQLETINSKLAGVVKDLNDIMIKELTGITSNQLQ